jgi:hypothetical protein
MTENEQPQEEAQQEETPQEETPKEDSQEATAAQSEAAQPAPAPAEVLLERPGNSIMEKIYMFDVFIAAGGVLLIIGGFLPWISIELGPLGSMSEIGLRCRWRGIVPFICGIAAPVLVFLQLQQGKTVKPLAIATLSCSGAAAGIVLISLFDIQDSMGFGLIVSLIGGLCATLGSAILFLRGQSWTAFFMKKLKP